jgi:hypothetical protein
MDVMKYLFILLITLLVSACQSDPLSGDNDPKSSQWSLEFTAPTYMTGWVEDSWVEDINGRNLKHGSGGVIGTGSVDYGLESELAKGWPRSLGGRVRDVRGADLPKRVFVRWQSVVEQKTYRAWIDIPEEARRIMHTSTHRRCAQTPDHEARYMASMHLGLAPGGIVQVWVRNECREQIKVARTKAEIEPLGPHLGQSGGHYYPHSEFSKRYIEKYGIPFGSW